MSKPSKTEAELVVFAEPLQAGLQIVTSVDELFGPEQVNRRWPLITASEQRKSFDFT